MPSQRLREYIEADKRIKEAEGLKSANRKYVERLLKKAKGLGVFLRGISYQEREKIKFDDNKLFDWVKQQCIEQVKEDGITPYDGEGVFFEIFNNEKWTSLTKTVIDEEKLEQAVQDGIIDLSNLPESCYDIYVSKVITVNHSKLNNE